jgi:hypothetical protein
MYWRDFCSLWYNLHRKLVRRIIMDRIQCKGCGTDVKVTHMEYHLFNSVNGMTDCEWRQKVDEINNDLDKELVK